MAYQFYITKLIEKIILPHRTQTSEGIYQPIIAISWLWVANWNSACISKINCS